MKRITLPVLVVFAGVAFITAIVFVLSPGRRSSTTATVGNPGNNATPNAAATSKAQSSQDSRQSQKYGKRSKGANAVPVAIDGLGGKHAFSNVRPSLPAPRPFVRQVPLEETPMAPPQPNPPDTATVKAFNRAADVLQKTFKNLDKSSILTSFNGLYALADCGNTFVMATGDGRVVIFQQSSDGKMFETPSGTQCPFVAQKDNYYLARLATGAYVLTTPMGEEYTLGGAQNAEDPRKPFSSNPAASATIATLASLKNDLPRDNELFTTPDKRLALISAGGKYILVNSDGSRKELPSIGPTTDRIQTTQGLTTTLMAGDPATAIGRPTTESIVLIEAIRAGSGNSHTGNTGSGNTTSGNTWSDSAPPGNNGSSLIDSQSGSPQQGNTAVPNTGDQSQNNEVPGNTVVPSSSNPPTPVITETVLTKLADGPEWDAVPPTVNDPNKIPPDLPTDPASTPAELTSTIDLLNKNEWDLSLSDKRVLRRLLAELSSRDASAQSL